MKYCLFIICTLFIYTDAISQGKIDGFYRGKGNAVAVFGLGYEDNKNYFIGTEKSDLSRSVYYAALYGSYGILDNLDVSISVPFISSNKNNDLQDISLFLKYRMFNKNVENGVLQVSVASGLSTPLSDYEIGGLNDIGQQATIIETRALAHYKWHSGWFATIQSGFSFKLNETPNSLPIVFKTGKAAGKWYYDVYYDYQHSFGGIDYRGTPSPQNFKEFGTDYHKVGGTLSTQITSNFGSYLSLSYVISGRNVFQGPGFGLGIVYNFKKQ
jgi:hypothetical protein